MRALPLLAVGLLALTSCSSDGDDAASTTAPSDDPGGTSPTTAQTPDPTEPTDPPVTDPPVTDPPATTAAPGTAPPPTTAPTTEPPATTGAPDSSDPPAPSTTLNPPIEPDDPFGADKQLALTALLTVEDFGEGWEVEPDIDDGDRFEELEAEFDVCIDPDDPDGGDVLEGRGVKSGEFEPIGANFPSINQEAGLVDTEADALAAMERVGSERALPCYQEFLPAVVRQAFADDDREDAPEVVVGDVTVDEAALGFPRDVAVGYRTTLTLTVDGDELVLVLDIRFLRQGRALSQLQFEGLNGPVDAGGQDTVTNLVLERLAAIGGPTVQT